MADTNENEEILFPQDEEDNSPVEEVEVTEEVAEEVIAEPEVDKLVEIAEDAGTVAENASSARLSSHSNLRAPAQNRRTLCNHNSSRGRSPVSDTDFCSVRRQLRSDRLSRSH